MDVSLIRCHSLSFYSITTPHHSSSSPNAEDQNKYARL
uniref:Uncharacterized protein n=1 Tax=Arundo donax TaxID=35708 RepID=A0A0A9FWD3_ARUDO